MPSNIPTSQMPDLASLMSASQPPASPPVVQAPPAQVIQSPVAPPVQQFQPNIPPAIPVATAPVTPVAVQLQQQAAGAGGFAPPVPVVPVAPVAPQQQQPYGLPIQPQPNQQQASPFAESLTKMGFEIDPAMTEQQVMETIATQLDQANEIRETHGPDNAEFAEWKKSRSAAPAAPAPGMQPIPAVPVAAVIPGTPTQISNEASTLATSGLIKRGEDGQWVSGNPAFQQYADEHNRFDAHRQATAQRLITDPHGFFKENMEGAGIASLDVVQKLQAEMVSMKAQLDAERASSASSQVDQWVNEHESGLFINGDRNQLTDYSQKYNAFSAQVDQMARSVGHTLDRAEIHTRTLELLGAAGIHVQPQAPVVPQPQMHQQPAVSPQQRQPSAFAPQVPQLTPQQQHMMPPTVIPQQQQQSFMHQAASQTPRLPNNRLTEFPAQQPNGAPTLTTGPAGIPNLSSIISHQQLHGVVNH